MKTLFIILTLWLAVFALVLLLAGCGRYVPPPPAVPQVEKTEAVPMPKAKPAIERDTKRRHR